MKNRIVVTIFALFLPIAFVKAFAQNGDGKPNPIEPGDYNLRLPNKRPNSTYPSSNNYNINLTASGSGPEFPIAVERHHVIPFETLRDFYNKVLENNHLQYLNQFLGGIAGNVVTYAETAWHNCNASDRNVAAAIDAENVFIAMQYRYARPGSSTSPSLSEFDFAARWYVWLPGNIFLGPSTDFRTNTVQNQFEAGAARIVGQTAFARLQALYADMRTYLTNGDIATLQRIARNLALVADNRQAIYPLRAEDWEQSGTTQAGLPKFKIKKPDSNIKRAEANIIDNLDKQTCDNSLINARVIGPYASSIFSGVENLLLDTVEGDEAKK
ncbi:Uncharacterised protein [Burkholderia pseudomallei]|nr:Uncharacterised protein [Burkholderia pseudomallei]